MNSSSGVLLLGGTGFVGRSVCERLVARSGGGGRRITVASRRLAHARDVQFLPGLEPACVDVHDDAQLASIVAGHEAVVNLIGILHGNAAAFDRVHVQLPRRLAAICERTGVRRVVHVSAIGASPQAPSLYLRSKADGEAALRAADLELSLLRPSVMFGSADRFLNLFARMQAVLPVVPLAGADARMQPVWVEDVAEAIVRCLGAAEAVGRTFECVGPRVYTLAQLVQIAGRLSGHERFVLALPQVLGNLQAGLMELWPGEPLISRDNLRSLTVPSVAGGELPGLDALGIRAAALEAVAPGYLAPGQGVARLDRWRAERLAR